MYVCANCWRTQVYLSHRVQGSTNALHLLRSCEQQQSICGRQTNWPIDHQLIHLRTVMTTVLVDTVAAEQKILTLTLGQLANMTVSQ